MWNKLHGDTGEKKMKIKGSVVLMKKNVLDFNDLHASMLDRVHEFFGKGVSLQLISSVNGDHGEEMPAMTCYLDAAIPPGYALAGDGSLPAPDILSGAPPATNTTPTTTTSILDHLSQLWSPSRSASLYRIDAWGPPYFSGNSSGDVTVRPYGSDTLPHQEIDLL